MFHKISDVFMSFANHYMKTCSESNYYKVYFDMIRDQLPESDR